MATAWLEDNGFKCSQLGSDKDCHAGGFGVHLPVVGAPFGQDGVAVELKGKDVSTVCATTPLAMFYSPRRTPKGRNQVAFTLDGSTCSVQVEKDFVPLAAGGTFILEKFNEPGSFGEKPGGFGEMTVSAGLLMKQKKRK